MLTASAPAICSACSSGTPSEAAQYAAAIHARNGSSREVLGSPCAYYYHIKTVVKVQKYLSGRVALANALTAVQAILVTSEKAIQRVALAHVTEHRLPLFRCEFSHSSHLTPGGNC